MKLFDRQGKAVDVPDEQAQDALTSGQYGLPAGSAVPVKLEDGTVGSVPFEHLQTALTGGASVVPQAEFDQAQLQAQYGDAKHAALAGATGALRGATFGLSDAAIRELGGKEVARTVAKSGEANPLASGGGEIAGALAPLVLSGGAAAPEEAALAGAEETSAFARGARTAGKVLSAPVDLASHAGEAAARATEGITSLVTKSPTAQRALSRLAQGAVEGGVLGGMQGGGDAISEASLGDTDLTGEKLLASIGHGALLGAAGGSALTGAGELGKAIVGTAAKHLDGLAGEQAFRSLLTSANKPIVREAERIPGGVKAVGQRMLDDGVIKVGDSVDELAPRVAEAKKSAGRDVGAVLQKADENGFAGPNIGRVLRGIEKEVQPRLSALPSLNAGAITRVDDLMNDIASYAGGQGSTGALRTTFEQAQGLRARIDDAIKWTTPGIGAPANEINDALKKTRGILEQEIEEAGDKAAKKLGGDFLTDYKDAKLRYRQYAVADTAVQDAVARRAANRAISPTDYLTGLGAAALEGGGHAMAGGIFAGLAGAMAHHVIRERGNATAAVILDKLASLQAVGRAARSADAAVDREVSAVLSPTTREAKSIVAPGTHAERVQAIQHSVAAPEVHQDRVEKIAAAIAQHAPNVARAFQATAERATAYLQKSLPKEAAPNPLLHAPSKEQSVPQNEQAKAARIYMAIHSPPSVLQSVSRGSVTQDQVDALKAVHPKTYQSMVDKIQKRLIAKPMKLPIEKRLALSTFLGVPLDPSLAPDRAFALQQSWHQPVKNPGPPKPPGGQRHKPMTSDFADAFALPGQRSHH